MTQKCYSHIIQRSVTSKIIVVDVGAQMIRSSQLLKKMRTPGFDDYFEKLLKMYDGQNAKLVEQFKSALSNAFKRSTQDIFADKWIDAYLSVFVQDDAISDVIDFVLYESISIQMPTMIYLPVRPRAIANDDYYFLANEGKYREGFDVSSNMHLLPVHNGTIRSATQLIAQLKEIH